MTSFTIARRELRRLQTRAVRANQNEICGLFFADASRRISLAFVPNRSADRRRFAMTRPDSFSTKRRGVDAGLRFLGIFHSHPTGAAKPSASDLKIRGGGVRYQLIFDVRGREARLWRVRDGQGSTVPLSLVP